MNDVLWWMCIASDIVFVITVCSGLWIAYVTLEIGKSIDELETQYLSLLDEALQILIPMEVLNHISEYDVANFEMTRTGVVTKIVENVTYAEDVSRPISEKSELYEYFGDSEKKKKPRQKEPTEQQIGRQIEAMKSLHSIKITNKAMAELLKNMTTEGKGKASSQKKQQNILKLTLAKTPETPVVRAHTPKASKQEELHGTQRSSKMMKEEEDKKKKSLKKGSKGSSEKKNSEKKEIKKNSERKESKKRDKAKKNSPSGSSKKGESKNKKEEDIETVDSTSPE